MKSTKSLKHDFIANKLASILFGAGYGTNIVCQAHKIIYELNEKGRPMRSKISKILEPRPIKRTGIRSTSNNFINNFIEAHSDYRKQTYNIVHSGNGTIRIQNTKTFADYIISFHQNKTLTLD
jgi:hypothetical protein